MSFVFKTCRRDPFSSRNPLKLSVFFTMSAKRKAVVESAVSAKKPKVNGTITSFFGPPKTASVAPSISGSAESTVSKITDTSSPSLQTAVTSTASSTIPSFTPARWDKEAWVNKLQDETKELLKLEIDTLDESWLRELREHIVSKDFLDLKRFLKKEKEQGKTIFPPEADIYSWQVNYSTFFVPIASTAI